MSLEAAIIVALMPYTVFAVAGLHGVRDYRRRIASVPDGGAPSAHFVLGRTPLQVGPVAVHPAITAAVQGLDSFAARHMTTLSIAAGDDLVVRADRLALHEVLTDLIGRAIGRSPCGGVLVTARQHGGRVEIAILDDGSAGSADAESCFSATSREIMAMHGATLESRPGANGMTEVVMRLLAPPDRVRPAPRVIEPAPAQDESRNKVVERSVRSSSSSEVGTA